MSTPSACQTTTGAGLAGGGSHGMATLNPKRASMVLAPETFQAPKAAEEVQSDKAQRRNKVHPHHISLYSSTQHSLASCTKALLLLILPKLLFASQ